MKQLLVYIEPIVYDRKLIGSISIEKKDDDAEIGYMLHNDYSNKGIGTEAVKQICPIAFKVLSLEQITANVFQPNITFNKGATEEWLQV